MRKTVFLLLALILGAGLLWFGCGNNNTPTAPGASSPQSAKLINLQDNMDRVASILQKHNPRLLENKDVVGTAVGLNPDGSPAVLVLARVAGARGIPNVIEDIPVRVEVTGEIRALGQPAEKGKPGAAVNIDPTARFDRPVPIGVSTGNAGECSAGTIGCRVKDASGKLYALSNNHVYALENNAPAGSDILQPGRYDTSCNSNPADVIGTLFDYETISFTATNTIDAAIALCTAGSLGNVTPSNGYGTPQSATSDASISMQVQKYGRTTALTKGQITGINVTVNVGYSSGTAQFGGQILVQSRKSFIRSGDSGSLLVTNPDCKPVGLLFAGNTNGTYAFANPIGPVLSAFGVSIDGK